LEIGAGPVQPLAREIGDDLLKTDSYRTALVRINPVRERGSQYHWEREEIEKLLKDHKDSGIDFEVPDFVVKDTRAITKEEDKQLAALKNQLIEIQLGAKEALRLIKNELIR
jgi:hypothetical protein